ncbi:ABC transporter permease [Candidatus Peregrinibacteria bacterium]|nr:ABC transporter permease [Candidatus Peregrinibacteria bacterium]MBI5732343.1 ABC transporter permease [Candidatus Jorgensenbacteria bacterium]
MIVTFSRIIKYGWQAFLRNGLLSVSTISIMVLAAVVFEGLILFNIISKNAISSIQEKIDISVYFKGTVTEDAILGIKERLRKLEEVSDVVYISKEQALDEFKARHAAEITVTQTLEELDANPLLASLNIKAKDSREYATIASYLDTKELGELVEKVSYAENQIVIERLNALIDTLKRGGILLTIFLAFLAIMVTFTTIRLAIYSNSEQIAIMRVVGASNSFIRGPYTIEGIIYGVVAGILSFLALVPLINFISPYVLSFIPAFNLLNYFRSELFSLLLYQLAFGVILGIISSVIAVRRYLRV